MSVNLYIIRHGEAVDLDKDPERPLSMNGNHEILKVSHFLKKSQIAVEAIYHSNKLRSQQSAQIIANTIDFNRPITLEPTLAPDNNVAALCNWVDNLSKDVILTGHLPNLVLLINYLLVGSYQKIALNFPTGAAVLLKKEYTTATWALDWFIKPDLID